MLKRVLAGMGVPPESKALFFQCSNSRLFPAAVDMPILHPNF